MEQIITGNFLCCLQVITVGRFIIVLSQATSLSIIWTKRKRKCCQLKKGPKSRVVFPLSLVLLLRICIENCGEFSLGPRQCSHENMQAL